MKNQRDPPASAPATAAVDDVAVAAAVAAVDDVDIDVIVVVAYFGT